MGKTCQICGKNSGMYPLCTEHLKMKSEGKVVKCEECGSWHLSNIDCKCKKATHVASKENSTFAKSEGKCIVCGENAPNGNLCRDCYYEMKDFKESFDKNSKVFDMKDYYFNLRSNIYRMKTFDYIKGNCNKLMAIANFVSEMFRDTSLVDRVVNDIKDVIEAKKPKEEEKVSEEIKQKDSHKEELRRTNDGHYVKSDPEVQIDDILYDARIVHCYEKKVPIDSDEQTLKCDWFIPITDSRHGIYIEYWGMNTKDYLLNKERKRKAYKEHNIPLIEIEKDDYKDKAGLTDRIISEINKLAKKHFNIIDYLK